MRIFIAGPSGAVGKRRIPLLVDGGNDVVGTTTSAEKVGQLRGLGALPIVLDLLDGEAVGAAVARAEPDFVVHEATALASLGTPRKLDRAFAQINRLRSEGTDHLLAAMRAAGVGRFVAQGYAGWPSPAGEDRSTPRTTRSTPYPPKGFEKTLGAIRHLEAAVLDADGLEGVVLRTAASADHAHRSARAAPTSRRCGSADSPSSGTAAGSGRSCTSTTRRL